MDERHLLAAARYVENNPVRAGLCGAAEDWTWSSARARLCGEDDGLVQVSPMLDIIPDWSAYLREAVDEELPEAIHAHLRTGRPLGSDAFVEHLERRLQRTLRRKKPGPKQP